MKAAFLKPSSLISLIVLLGLIILSASSGLIGDWRGVDAKTLDLSQSLMGVSLAHPMGTDAVGRDFMAQLLEGGRASLGIAFSAALIAGTIGAVIGLLAGYLGGAVDSILMRLTDGTIALPLLPLLIILSAVDPAKLGFDSEWARSEGVSLLRVVLIVSLFGWTSVARLTRAQTLSVLVQPFLLSARALGAGGFHIVLRHVLPNVASTLIVAVALSVGNIILLESALSFLGLGVQPPTPSWGNMLSGALEKMYDAPDQILWPGAMIFLCVLSFNLLGDALQELLDPRRRQARHPGN